MSDLGDLYQQVILDHNRSPRNFGKLADANRQAEGYNPLCGDHFTVYLKVENGVIQDVGFQGSGCAISKASSSLMSAFLKGKTQEEAEKLFQTFHEMVMGKLSEPERLESLGKLVALSGVCDYPARVKCASLAWHAMIAALKGESREVSTE
ncbi:MAG: SUF system NifU family Fe-S cluster assembly protein [Acidobacteria bacterium]|nr:SUF system NifU family Fe-S cluster assembly protein [Acidobacteriota bacterium]